MKHSARLALFSLLFLGACGQKQTETTVEQAPPQAHQEAAERENNGTPDLDLSDPRIAAGEETYEANCAGCHDSGTAGAPKPGRKEDWKDRMGLGVELLTKKSIEGYDGKTGSMPAKGGNAELTDDEVSNAVKYMVFRSR